MSVITKMRKQKAVYWAPGTNDGMGRQAFANGVIIDCRWEDVIVEVLNKEGEKVISKSTVYVDRDVELDGYLSIYESSAPLVTANPEDTGTAFRILSFGKLPNFKGTEYLRTAYL